VRREDLERRESAMLAPYAMVSAESAGRVHAESEPVYRTCYQRDRDRIIHCKAFRRLEYKTQVFLNHESDHYRTRMTHTIEVTQIARSLARSLGLNEDLTEAVALAHDVGHTPFGHGGERTLAMLMKDHGGFEHNAHGLRVVDHLENQYPSFSGLNLTHEVRACIVKHHTRWDHPCPSEFAPGPPLLEGQVVELADAIAYDNHDLLDGLDAGILTLDALRAVPLWKRAEDEALAASPEMTEHQLCKQAVRKLVNLFVTDATEFSAAAIARHDLQSWRDACELEGNLVAFSPELCAQKEDLEEFLYATLYRDYRVMRANNSAQRFMCAIFESYIDDPRQLPPHIRPPADEDAPDALYRAVADYVAGMTDRYAQDLYIQMFHPYPRI
jgi:dGTPase